VKASYNSLLEARISLSYQFTYPENLMEKSEKVSANATGGWTWTGVWSTHDSFEGSYGNGASDRLKTDLRDTKDSLQNAVDSAFPIDTAGQAHAIFTDQLTVSYDQATAWLASLNPLFNTMKTGGLSNEEAWNRVLVYTKALFEDIKTVRALSAERSCGAMIWGSFRTAELLAEYMRLRWLQHPQVSSILALTSMQREGKALNDALSSLGTVAADVKSIKKDIKQWKKAKPPK